MMPPVSIRRYPTRLAVRCVACGHQGEVSVFLDKAPRLRCSICGDGNPVVGGRDTMRAWAMQRMKQNARAGGKRSKGGK